ncbi:MAG: hypothetical protein U0271_46950 [Polyangiaceae bacterium]
MTSGGSPIAQLMAIACGCVVGLVGCRDREDPALARACASACNCKQQGLCGALSGHCAATRAEDCRASNICRLSGKCDVKDGRCVAGSQEDCAQSAYCRDFGLCALSDNHCVKQAASSTPR